MKTMPTDAVAKLCWDHYYKTELDNVQKIHDYLKGYDRHDNTFENLTEALYDDIRDLLHNGNQEDLFGPMDDGTTADKLADELHDGWANDPDPLDQLCEALSRIALDTITKETQND